MNQQLRYKEKIIILVSGIYRTLDFYSDLKMAENTFLATKLSRDLKTEKLATKVSHFRNWNLSKKTDLFSSTTDVNIIENAQDKLNKIKLF